MSHSHSIAQLTGTRLDSSAKHIVPCRVNHDIFARTFQIPEKKMTEDKYRYAMQKDEIVLDVGRKTDVEDVLDEFIPSDVKHPYPSVITTLGDKAPEGVLAGIQQYFRNVDMTNEDLPIIYTADGRWKAFPYKFGFVGVALGTAYASDLSGDNVGSVLVGGMATVLNGHFPCYTGELVQWYFDFERDEYDEEGFRIPGAPAAVDGKLLVPRRGPEQWYKQRMFAAYKETNGGKNRVALIKPYRPVRVDGKRKRYLYGDRLRVVGRIVNGGMPWEPVDIFLSNTFV
eukprot:763500-Hanusia_phi.AAC.6